MRVEQDTTHLGSAGDGVRQRGGERVVLPAAATAGTYADAGSGVGQGNQDTARTQGD